MTSVFNASRFAASGVVDAGESGHRLALTMTVELLHDVVLRTVLVEEHPAGHL